MAKHHSARNLVPKHKSDHRVKGGDIHMSEPAMGFSDSNPDEATRKTGIAKGHSARHPRLAHAHAMLVLHHK